MGGTTACVCQVMCCCRDYDVTPAAVGSLYPPLGEARFYKVERLVGKLPPATHRRNVGVWQDGIHHCNVVLATVKGAKESWAVITDEPPTLQTMQAICPPVQSGGVINGIASQGCLRSEDSRLRVQLPLLNACIWSQRLPFCMPPLRAWRYKLLSLRQQVDPKKATGYQRFS